MKKPEYELEPLKKAVAQCDTNIEALRKGIIEEEVRKQEMMRYIEQWEIYNKLQEE